MLDSHCRHWEVYSVNNTMTTDPRKYYPDKHRFSVHSGCTLYGITGVGAIGLGTGFKVQLHDHVICFTGQCSGFSGHGIVIPVEADTTILNSFVGSVV